MFVRFIISFLLISISVCAQQSVSEFSDDDLTVYKMTVVNLDENEASRLLDKRVMPMENVFFCSFSKEDGESYVVVTNDFDLSLFTEKLEAYGYELGTYSLESFNELEFFIQYVNYQEYGTAKTISDQPEMIKTGNYIKDFEAYKKAKDIYLKYNSEN